MKNSKLRRALLLLACAVMLVSLSVGATLAYLQATTEVVKNSFAVGRVYISLDEARVNQYGEWMGTLASGDPDIPDFDTVVYTKEEADRVQTNHYKLYPGKQYPKDPTVHVYNDSETCYVFVKLNKTGLTYTKTITKDDGTTEKVTVDIEAATGAKETGNADAAAYVRIADQILGNDWVKFADDTDGCPIYLYKYLRNTLDGGTDLVVFENFLIAAEADVPVEMNNSKFEEQMAELDINIIAFAIQAEGFSTYNLSNDASDNDLAADTTGATAAWNAAQFNTSFDQ